jgi:hypothetical protein
MNFSRCEGAATEATKLSVQTLLSVRPIAMPLIDPKDTFYAPAWRRYLIVAIVAAWFAYELLVSREGFWMAISGGMLALALWSFIITWPGSDAKDTRNIK